MFGQGAKFGGISSESSVIPPLTGTFTVHIEPDASFGNSLSFQTITAIPAYQNFSQEECRIADYTNGKRYGIDSTSSLTQSPSILPRLKTSTTQGGLYRPGSGTGNILYKNHQERDATSYTTLTFQSIEAMQEFRDVSREELRVEDYILGRKEGNPTIAPTTKCNFGSDMIKTEPNRPLTQHPNPLTDPSAPAIPFQQTLESENGGETTVTFFSIEAMQVYLGISREELRVHDYQVGRKGPTNVSGSGLFGSSTSSVTMGGSGVQDRSIWGSLRPPNTFNTSIATSTSFTFSPTTAGPNSGGPPSSTMGSGNGMTFNNPSTNLFGPGSRQSFFGSSPSGTGSSTSTTNTGLTVPFSDFQQR